MNKIKRTPAIIPPSKYGFIPDPSDFERVPTVAFAITVIAGRVGSVSGGKGLVFDFIAATVNTYIKYFDKNVYCTCYSMWYVCKHKIIQSK